MFTVTLIIKDDVSGAGSLVTFSSSSRLNSKQSVKIYRTAWKQLRREIKLLGGKNETQKRKRP